MQRFGVKRGVEARRAAQGERAYYNLAALAGLSENDPRFQPGFEDADTSLLAAVPFYGVYDLTNSAGHYYPELREWAFEQVVIKLPLEGNREVYEQASPLFRVHPDAPPFMVIHGSRDTLTPVGDARDFTAALAAVSRSAVIYVELPGAEHVQPAADWFSEHAERNHLRIVNFTSLKSNQSVTDTFIWR